MADGWAEDRVRAGGRAEARKGVRRKGGTAEGRNGGRRRRNGSTATYRIYLIDLWYTNTDDNDDDTF
jgi:hypothetical protein